VKVGLSTCPNDTFAFHGLLSGAVEAPGLELELVLADVQELNEALLAGELDVAKGSFAAALEGGLDVLRTGAALGFGVGPIVLRSPIAARDSHDARVLAPGRWTTAALLWRLFHPEAGEPEHVLFSEIVPALVRGEAELGVCIHEARFTWQESGLERVEDLGERWERATGTPLPLGGILVRPELDEEPLARLASALRASIDHGFAHKGAALATMRAHAQEQADEVLWQHVELYVNTATRDLGAAGEAALLALHECAQAAGLAPPHARPPRVRG
jgi:1,4-dihydroxy-6-naphthoate synthase